MKLKIYFFYIRSIVLEQSAKITFRRNFVLKKLKSKHLFKNKKGQCLSEAETSSDFVSDEAIFKMNCCTLCHPFVHNLCNVYLYCYYDVWRQDRIAFFLWDFLVCLCSLQQNHECTFLFFQGYLKEVLYCCSTNVSVLFCAQ